MSRGMHRLAVYPCSWNTGRARLSLEVRDDGQGFSLDRKWESSVAADGDGSGHYGWTGMKERAAVDWRNAGSDERDREREPVVRLHCTWRREEMRD